MREPLKLSESEIVAAVETRYGISTAALSFLPLGNDSATAVYRLDAPDGTPYFCKVRTAAGFSVPSLAVPQFLCSQGISHILAPLPNLNHNLWVAVNGFALTLYPFIEEGRTAAHAGLTDLQWREFGVVVREFHHIRLTPELLALLPREKFVPNQRELIPALEAAITRGVFENDAERELAEFWRTQQSIIQRIVSRVDALGERLRESSAPRVLCHADMHTYNVLLNQANEFWLVDWDEVILALPERDLMFVVGGISSTLVSPQQTELFLQGYGDPTLDSNALSYYRYAWAVQDLAAYGESVCLLAGASQASRREAVLGLIGLFASGEIVEMAMASGS